ncbi:MAG: hypothetical protein WCV73_01980 [Patescibacteria group bacterium]|jgi:asparagine N-glycosylation enzyme membrane subunit Stt3
MEYKVTKTIEYFTVVNFCLTIFFLVQMFRRPFSSSGSGTLSLYMSYTVYYSFFLVIFLIFSIHLKNKKAFLINFIFSVALLLIVGYVALPLTKYYARKQWQKIMFNAIKQGDVGACDGIQKGLSGFYMGGNISECQRRVLHENDYNTSE